MTDLEAALTFNLNDEGGLAIRSDEPGGSCKDGISFVVLQDYRKRHGLPAPVLQDLIDLTDDQAKAIYTELFVTPLRFTEIPSPLNYVLFNTAVMQGVMGAIFLLQKALGVSGMGTYDSKTWAAVQVCNAREAALSLIIEHMAVKMHDPACGPHKDLKTGADIHGFGPGWADRLKRVRDRALRWLGQLNVKN